MCTSLGIELGLLHVPEGEEVVVYLVRAGADTRLRILLDENLPRVGPDEGIADPMECTPSTSARCVASWRWQIVRMPGWNWQSRWSRVLALFRNENATRLLYLLTTREISRFALIVWRALFGIL